MNSWSWIMKAVGSAGVLLGALCACEQQLCRERRHIRTLWELSQALEAMKGELLRCAAPVEELLAAAGRSASEELSALFSQISVKNLENRTFSQQWTDMARNNALHLSARERRALERPGMVLGRCDVEEQGCCLAQTADELRQFARGREEALRERKRVWYTLSLSAGALLVIMLI